MYNKYPNLEQIETTFNHTSPDGTYNYKIVDNQQIGIIPESLADTYNHCSGDPTNHDSKERNPHEQEVIEIMGKLLGIPNVAGYLTSGGTEGNLAAIWFCKNNLIGKSLPLIKEIKA